MGVVANVAINVDAAGAIQQLNRVRDAAAKLNAEFGQTPQTSERTKNGFHGIAGAVAALTAKLAAGYTAAKLLSDSLGTFFTRSQAEQQLKNLTSGAEEYNAALALAERQVQMFGISQTEATKAIGDVYSKLSGVGYGLKEVGEIYQGFNIIVTQTGVASQDAAGAFFQLSQALAKGKLNGDEFVTISERMPQLLTAISQNTGIARSQFKEMAEQGKLTGQLIYQALAEASKGAGDLNRFLTGQAVAMSNLKVAADRLFYVIGELFGSTVTAATQEFANLLGKIEKAVIENYGNFKKLLGVLTAIAKAVLPAMKNGFQFVLNNIKAILQTVTFFGTFIGILKGIVLATQAWTVATNALATAQKVAALAATVLQAILNPASLAKVAIAIGGATAATALLGKAMDNAAKNSTKIQDESHKLLGEIDAVLEKYSSMPEIIEKGNEAQSAKTKLVQDELTALKAGTQEINNQIRALEGAQSLQEKRFAVEKALNDLGLQRLKREYDQEKSTNRRFEILQQILRQEIIGARIEYNQAIARLKIEQQKLDLQFQAAVNKKEEIELEAALQRLKALGTEDEAKRIDAINRETKTALGVQDKVIAGLDQQNIVQKQILQEEAKLAKIKFISQKLTAQQNFEQKAVSDEIGLSVQQAQTLSQNIANSIDVTNTLAGSMKNVAIQATNAAQQIRNAINLYREAGNQGKQNGGAPQQAAEGAYWSGGFKAFADGGVVSKPTLGLVGEGGESEYIIPASKMDEAMARYASGQRGSSVIPSSINPQVNVTTGPVMNMNGSNYVSQNDFLAGMQTASRRGAEMALQMLSGSSGARRMAGIG